MKRRNSQITGEVVALKKNNNKNSDNNIDGNKDKPQKLKKPNSSEKGAPAVLTPSKESPSGDAPAPGDSSVTSDLVTAMDTDAGPKPIQSSTPKRTAIDKMMEMAHGFKAQDT